MLDVRRAHQVLTRVPKLAWGIAAALLALPMYLRFFAWALGQCGVGFWAPLR